MTELINALQKIMDEDLSEKQIKIAFVMLGEKPIIVIIDFLFLDKITFWKFFKTL